MKFGSNLFKGLRSLEAEPQVARRSERNFPFETRCSARVSTQIYKKKDRPFRTVFPEIAHHTPFTHARREKEDSGLQAAGCAFLFHFS